MSGFQRYIHTPASPLPEHHQTFLARGEDIIPFLEAPEFRLTNPWSFFFRSVLTQLRDESAFSGKQMHELGVGDGRNFFHMGDELKNPAGIDAHMPMLQLAAENLAHLKFPVDLYFGDAVAFVKQPGEAWDGYVAICLPQTPPQETSENKLVGTFRSENPHLEPYAEWKTSGLQLVAATLGELVKRAKHDLRVLLLLSGRVPTAERETMIHSTGWAIRRVLATNESDIAQQSAYVSLAYTQVYADSSEHLFWERTATGVLAPIDPIEAEKRRLAAYNSSTNEHPNVYHHLYVYLLEPKGRTLS